MLLEYRLESVLGAGGFGMTYLGYDTLLEKKVAIKEYLPVELAVRSPDGAIVPINSRTSSRDMPMPLSEMVMVRAALSQLIRIFSSGSVPSSAGCASASPSSTA